MTTAMAKPKMGQAELRTLSEADAVLKAKGRSFHWARYLLGSAHAARATRLYAFCRYIDDLADNATSIDAAQQKLAAANRAITAGRSFDPLISDALSLMRECRIDPLIVLELIKGVASDLDSVRMPDEEALLRYCYRVAGTVGLMMCRVLDVDDSAAFPHAIDLGIGMQLTNICRDVADDAAAGRRYLPSSMIGDLVPRALINPTDSLRPRLRQCLADLLDLADHHYRSGQQGLAYLPISARGAMLVAGRVYRAIGVQLRRHDYAYWEKRMVVHNSTKAALTASALLTMVVTPSFWRPSHPHETGLHARLHGLPYTAPYLGANHAG